MWQAPRNLLTTSEVLPLFLLFEIPLDNAPLNYQNPLHAVCVEWLFSAILQFALGRPHYGRNFLNHGTLPVCQKLSSYCDTLPHH